MAETDETPLRVLVVDDNPGDALLVRSYLQTVRPEAQVRHVETVDLAAEQVRLETWDVVLVDYYLRGATGLDVIARLGGTEADPALIVLTGQSSSAIDQQALEAGADDYLEKDALTPTALDRATRYARAKRRERQQLRDESLTLRTLLDALPFPVLVTRPAVDRVRLANTAAAHLLGSPSGQVDHRTWAGHLFDPATAANVLGVLQQGGVLTNRELTCHLGDPDGERVMLVSARPVALGGDHGMIVAFNDITRRRRTEDALRETERLLAQISSAARDAIVTIDPEGRVRFWNRGAEKMFGYTALEVQGRLVHDIIAPGRYRAGARHGLTTYAENGTGPLVGRPVEIEALRRDGSEFPVEIVISPMEWEGRWWATANLRDITDRQKARAELERMARTDPLTGALNRRAFITRGQEEIRRIRRYGGALTVITVDLDHFKQVNDTHGHAAGDEALVALVRVLQGMVRGTDVLARLGGEEFALMLPETPHAAGLDMAERLRARVADTPVRLENGRDLALTLSAGVAAADPTSDTLDTLLNRADTHLYEAKQAGRNRVRG